MNPTTTVPAPPAGYENDLSDYQEVGFDAYCGKPLSWGFRLRGHLGEDRFNALRQHGELVCVGFPNGRWSLIVKRLSKQEALDRYGAVTQEERGPRGGFRSITFGTTKFISHGIVGV